MDVASFKLDGRLVDGGQKSNFQWPPNLYAPLSFSNLPHFPSLP